GQGRCIQAISEPVSSSAAETPSPTDKLPQRSLSQPAPTGPMVCPTANRLVTTARPLPHAARGKLVFTKLVAAAGTMKTLAPTRADDIHTPTILGMAMGSA